MKLLIAAALAGTALSAGAAPQSVAQTGPGACYTRLPGGPPAPMSPGGVWTIERGTGMSAVWRFQEGPGSPGPGPGWASVDCATGRAMGPGVHAGHPVPPPPGDVFAQAPRPPEAAPMEPSRERRVIIIRPNPRLNGQPVPPMAAVPAPDPHRPPMMEHGPRPLPPMVHHQPAPPMAAPVPHHAPPPMVRLEPRHPAPPPMVHLEPRHPTPPMAGHAPHHALPPMAHHIPPPLAHGPMHGAPMMEPGFAPPPPPPVAFAFPPEPAPPAVPPRWFGDRYLTWAGKP